MDRKLLSILRDIQITVNEHIQILRDMSSPMTLVDQNVDTNQMYYLVPSKDIVALECEIKSDTNLRELMVSHSEFPSFTLLTNSISVNFIYRFPILQNLVAKMNAKLLEE